MQASTHDEDSELHIAARFGNIEELDELLSSLERERRDEELNSLGLYRWTALQEACANGDEEIVQVLLKYGADVRTSDGLHRRSALHYAAEAGQEEIVSLLLAECNLGVEDKRRWIGAKDDEQKSASDLAPAPCRHVIDLQFDKPDGKLFCVLLLEPNGAVTSPELSLRATAAACQQQEAAQTFLETPPKAESTQDAALGSVIQDPGNSNLSAGEDQQAINLPHSSLHVGEVLPGGVSPFRPVDKNTASLANQPPNVLERSISSGSDGSKKGDGKNDPSANTPQLNIAFEYNSKADRLKVRVKQASGLPLLTGDLAINASLYVKSTLHPSDDGEQDTKRKSEEVSLDSICDGMQADKENSLFCLPACNFKKALHYERIGDVKDVRRTIRVALCCRHGQWLAVSEELAFMSVPLYQAVTYLMPRWYNLQLREVLQKKSLLGDNRHVPAGRVYGLSAAVPKLDNSLSVHNYLDASIGSTLSVHSASTIEEYIADDKADADSIFGQGSVAGSMWATTTKLFGKLSQQSSSSSPTASSPEPPSQNLGNHEAHGAPGVKCARVHSGETNSMSACDLNDTQITGNKRTPSDLTSSRTFQCETSHKAVVPSHLFRSVDPAKQQGNQTVATSLSTDQQDKPLAAPKSSRQTTGPAEISIEIPEGYNPTPLHLFQSTEERKAHQFPPPLPAVTLTDRSLSFPACSKSTPVDLFQTKSSLASKDKLHDDTRLGDSTASQEEPQLHRPPVNLFQRSVSQAACRPDAGYAASKHHEVGKDSMSSGSCTHKDSKAAAAPAHLFKTVQNNSAQQQGSFANSLKPKGTAHGHSPLPCLEHSTRKTFGTANALQAHGASSKARAESASASGYGHSDVHLQAAYPMSFGAQQTYATAATAAAASDYWSDEELLSSAPQYGETSDSPMHQAYAATANIWSGGSSLNPHARPVNTGLFTTARAGPADHAAAAAANPQMDVALAALDPQSPSAPAGFSTQPRHVGNTHSHPLSVPDIGASFPGSTEPMPTTASRHKKQQHRHAFQLPSP